MQLQTMSTPSEKVAAHYRNDFLALGATDVIAKPAGVLVVAPDAARGSMLASVLSASPHDVRVQVAVGATDAEQGAPSASALADALAGARLAGVSAVSWTEGGTTFGTRISAHVSVHVVDAAREQELKELLRTRVGMQIVDGVPSPDTGVRLRVTTTPAREPDQLIHVIPVTPAS